MWKTAWFCIACNIELTYKQKMYSYGRCPLCGYKGENTGTIVETYEKGYRLVEDLKANKYRKEYR